jgi:hypothetical protein
MEGSEKYIIQQTLLEFDGSSANVNFRNDNGSYDPISRSVAELSATFRRSKHEGGK